MWLIVKCKSYARFIKDKVRAMLGSEYAIYTAYLHKDT